MFLVYILSILYYTTTDLTPLRNLSTIPHIPHTVYTHVYIYIHVRIHIYIYTHVYRCWTNNKQQKVDNFKSINLWYIHNTTLQEDGSERGGEQGDENKHNIVCKAYTKFLQLGHII